MTILGAFLITCTFTSVCSLRHINTKKKHDRTNTVIILKSGIEIRNLKFCLRGCDDIGRIYHEPILLYRVRNPWNFY